MTKSRSHKEFLGGYAEGVTPVPIPNTEVKPLRVDGTAWVAMWESRSPPGILLKTPQHLIVLGRFCVQDLKALLGSHAFHVDILQGKAY